MSEIDVSKCDLNYNDGRCFASQKQGVGYSCHKSDYCKYNTNCYYKQLQQLKTENEELKNKNESIHSIADDLQKRNHYLTQENERYIQCINEIVEYCKEQNLKYDTTACDILRKINEVKE